MSEMPHSEIIRIMKLMDGFRKNGISIPTRNRECLINNDSNIKYKESSFTVLSLVFSNFILNYICIHLDNNIFFILSRKVVFSGKVLFMFTLNLPELVSPKHSMVIPSCFLTSSILVIPFLYSS